MSRKTAREHAFRILFSAQFQRENAELLINRYFGEETPDEKDLEFVRGEVEGTITHLESINEKIEGALEDWKLSRLSHVDLAIFQIAGI